MEDTSANGHDLPTHPFWKRRKRDKLPRKPTRELMTVVLTGSTGNLGAYILDLLQLHPKVERVYCLNRSLDAPQRQKESHAFRGLSTSFPSSRIQFLRANFADPTLGLSPETYSSLTAHATIILHNAWPVDFNRTLSSFEPSIQGVRHLLTFAHSSVHDCRFFFVSSISVAANWGAVPGARLKVPEVELEDWKLARMGYGQSKLIAERLIAEATRVSGVTAAVCRLGQLAGPVLRAEKGMWPKREWAPSLIASARAMGMVPKHLGPVDAVDWVPVDIAAKVMVELLTFLPEQQAGKVEFHHVVNPREVPWAKLLPTVLHHLPNGIKVVDLPTWVQTLTESMRAGNDPEANPAAKLLPFFESLGDKSVRFPKARAPTLNTKKTVLRSQQLAKLGQVNEQWMTLWMKQWSKS